MKTTVFELCNKRCKYVSNALQECRNYKKSLVPVKQGFIKCQECKDGNAFNELSIDELKEEIKIQTDAVDEAENIIAVNKIDIPLLREEMERRVSK